MSNDMCNEHVLDTAGSPKPPSGEPASEPDHLKRDEMSLATYHDHRASRLVLDDTLPEPMIRVVGRIRTHQILGFVKPPGKKAVSPSPWRTRCPAIRYAHGLPVRSAHTRASRASRRTFGVVPVVLAMIALGGGTARGDDAPFAPCRAAIAEAPRSREAGACFYKIARKTLRWDEARSQLGELLKRSPDDPGLLLALANIESDQRSDRCIELYIRAAAGFRHDRAYKGAVYAHLNAASYVSRQGDHDRADSLIGEAVKLAAESGDPLLGATARLERGRQLAARGGDLGAALTLLRDAESMLGADAPYQQRLAVGHWTAKVLGVMGRFDEAATQLAAVLELVRARQDRYVEATVLYNLANLLEDRAARAPEVAERRPILDALEKSLAAAVESRNEHARASVHSSLSRLSTGADAARHAQACVDVVRDSGAVDLLVSCLGDLALALAPSDAARADSALDEAERVARRAAVPRLEAGASQIRSLVYWLRGQRDRALAQSRLAMSAIEAMRDHQHDDQVRDAYFAEHAGFYLRVAGLLLDEGDPDRSAEALLVVERMRSRSLLEAMDRAGATAGLARASGPTAEARRDVIDQIAAVQRRLARPSLTGDDRAVALEELGVLERRESDLRRTLAAESERFTALRPVELATVADVTEALLPDEALFSFQTAHDVDLYGARAGGSHLLVMTRAGVRHYRLPSLRAIETAVDFYSGLVHGDAAARKRAAAALGDMLIGAAVGELPATVSRLVIVPHGSLYRVPFAALAIDRRPGSEPGAGPTGDSSDGAPLVTRYVVAYAPSATTWLRWRERGQPLGARALVYADPTLAAAGEMASEGYSIDRQATLATGLALGPLPHARLEARTVAELLGADATLRMGDEASERDIKGAALDRFGILHFAAHAIVDEHQAHRSAVLLAPGDPREDGILQQREIAELGFDGQLVILSACASAAGRVLRGEGVASLARAFLLAGAHSVVGALWQIEDADAEMLFRGYYQHLAAGYDAATALALAQRQLISAGADYSAWAPMVVIGAGNAALPGPVATAGSSRRTWVWAGAGGLAALILVLALLGWRRRAQAT